MFDDGVAPPEPDAAPPEMVVTEIDGVVLRRQRPRGLMEARIAVAYTGKREVSSTARHRKRQVTGNVVVAGLWPEGSAGQVIYAWLSRSVGVHPARHLLVSRTERSGSARSLDHLLTHKDPRVRRAATRAVQKGRRISQKVGSPGDPRNKGAKLGSANPISGSSVRRSA
jgi:hypothetical protein